MTDNVSLSIELDEFKEHKKEAEKEYTKQYDGAEGGLLYEKILWDTDCWEFNDGVLVLSGSLPKVGFLSIEVVIPNDLTVQIIEHKTKQFNKLKTVLEAVK